MMDQVLSMLGLAKKAGRVETGEEPVGAAARARKARVILVARDAGPSSQRRAFSFAQTGACLCLTVPADKDALGRALGRTSCAMCAVTDIGFAQSLVQKLAAADPAQYTPAAEALAVKAKRARERKDEQLRHEKNLRRGKHRTHEENPAPPAEAPQPPREEKKRPSRPPREQRKRTRSAPTGRYDNALPVKKGKGSPRKGGK